MRDKASNLGFLGDAPSFFLNGFPDARSRPWQYNIQDFLS
jgi:hypothetical protein